MVVRDGSRVDGIARQVYRTQQLEPEVAEKLRLNFRAHLKDDQKRLTAEAVRQAKRLEDLVLQRRKLLNLHYKEAIAQDLFEEEQLRINREIKMSRVAIEEAKQDWDEIDKANDELFRLIQDLESLYRGSTEAMRRRMNRLIYTKILVDSEEPIKVELAEPPSREWMIRSMRVARKAVSKTDGALALAAIQAAHPVLVSVGPGSNIVTLVELNGFEPSTPCLPSRCSTN